MTVQAPIPDGLDGLATGPMTETPDLTLLNQSPANPSRPLDWRWSTATFLARTGSRTRLRWIDGAVRRAERFLCRGGRPGGRGRSPAPELDPVIVLARSLRAGPARVTRTALEALILAGFDDLAVAARVGLAPDVVAVYHDYFFEIRPILASADAVLARAFGPALYGPAVDRDLAVKLLSFFGGPVVADALVRAVVLPSPSATPGDDLGGIAEVFEDFALASSLPIDHRTGSVLLRLNDRAGQLARDQLGATVAGVTRPIATECLDARTLTELGDPVHESGPVELPSRSPMRAAGAPGDVIGGPREVDVAGRVGLPEGCVRLGIAG